METVVDAQGVRLHVATADLAERLVFRVGADGSLTPEPGAALPTGGIPAGDLAAIEVAGSDLLVVMVPLSATVSEIAALDLTTGQSHGFPGAGSRASAVAVAETGTGAVVYVAYADGSAVDVYARAPDGSFVRTATLATGGDGGIAGLQIAQVAGQTFLIVADHGGDIRSLAVAPGGGLSLVDAEGAATGLGLNGPAAAEVVTLAGATYLIQAATGSSSISVLRIEADGSLTPTDHVIDSLSTRFQSVTAMDVVTVNGQVYVIAGGADGGVSLFSLLPDGTLYVHGAVTDTEATTLRAVNAIEAVVADGRIEVFVSSAAEPGFTRITLTPGPAGLTQTGGGGADTLTGGTAEDVLFGGAGNDSLSGGGGDDILIDGAGSDSLRGGSGADVFVLSADGAADVILDFDPARDRLDLSRWPLLRNPGQLEVTPMPWGARISYGDEVLDLYTIDGVPLSAAQIAALGVVNLDHALELALPVGVRRDGTPGSDTLEGTPMADVLNGLGGNDTLRGRGGGDLIDGGAGFDVVDYTGLAAGVTVDLADSGANAGGAQGDTLTGVEGVTGTALSDVLRGDAGANALVGGAGNDVLAGRGGDDRLEGGDGDDLLDGGDGDDALPGGAGNDTIFGGAGKDEIAGGDGNDLIDGGPGNDNIGGGAGHDTLEGGEGNDFLGGGDGNDVVRGGAGHDAVSGGSGADWLEGGEGNDTMSGSYHDDTIAGGGGHDNIGGGPGADLIEGGAGNDTIGGGAGRDIIHGDAGDDFLAGGDGADLIFGGDGSDRLNGGGGNDTMTGGAGADVFVFNLFTPGEADRITDFEDGLDRFVISGIAGSSLQARLDALRITDTPTGVSMEWNGHMIAVDGISAADLTLDDFTFL